MAVSRVFNWVLAIPFTMLLSPMLAKSEELPVSKDASATESFKDCGVCPELVRIPPGSFTMGSTEEETTRAQMKSDRARYEKPQLQISIDYSFAIGRYEVMIDEFAAFVDETGYKAKGCFEMRGQGWGMNPRAYWRDPGYPVTGRYPAGCLNSKDSQAYIGWLTEKTGQSYRFPSEAEWEYVARIGLDEVQVWTEASSEACELFNGADASFAATFQNKWRTFECDDGYGVTAPAGSYRPNNWGMYDVFGNVSEWTQDCFSPNHENAPVDGSAKRTRTCSALVSKGGSWAGEPGYFRPAVRIRTTKNARGIGFGLRVLREIE